MTFEPEIFASHPNRGFLAPGNKCGASRFSDKIRIGPKVVGGDEALIGEYPWLANLGYIEDGSSEVKFRCGGVLIGERYVITAAHCVPGTPEFPAKRKLTTVRLGEHKLSTDIDCGRDPKQRRNSPPICNDPPQEFDLEEM